MVAYTARIVSSPERDLGILLGLAYQTFVDELNAHLATAGFDGVGPSFGYVFRALLGGSLTTSQLAAGLRITPQGAAKIVDDMVAAGYVERRSDPGDGRARQLHLTGRGRRAVATARRFHAEYEWRLARRCGRKRAAALREVLAEIVDSDAAAADSAARLLRPM
jgi:MarR family transcriptional regulator for hemolysin